MNLSCAAVNFTRRSVRFHGASVYIRSQLFEVWFVSASTIIAKAVGRFYHFSGKNQKGNKRWCGLKIDLNMPETMVREIVILDRMGFLDK